MTNLTKAVELLREVQEWLEPLQIKAPGNLLKRVDQVLQEHDKWHRGENTLRYRLYGDALYLQVVWEAPGRCKWEVRPFDPLSKSSRVLAKGETYADDKAKEEAVKAAREYLTRCKK